MARVIAVDSLVLVQEDTIYRESRIDHYARLMLLQRPKVTGSKRHLAAMSLPRPPDYSMFADRFTSVYSDLEVIGYNELPPNLRPLALLSRPSIRIEDAPQEESFHRIDQGLLFQFVKGKIQGFLWSTAETPELSSLEWQEWQRYPDPAKAFAPFRNFFQSTPNPPLAMGCYNQEPASRVEAEVDFRLIDHAARLFPFRQQTVIAPPTIIRVEAVQVGYYFSTRNIGDVFDVDVSHFASALVDFILGEIGDPFFGWMIIVSPTTPLATNTPSPLTTANKPRTVL